MTKIGVTKNSAKKRRDAYVRKHKLKGFSLYRTFEVPLEARNDIEKTIHLKLRDDQWCEGTNAKELFLISPEEATIIVEEIILENKTAQEAIAREKAKWAENERLRKIREKEKLEKERARLEEIERLRKQRQREIDREMLIQARRIEAWNKSDVNFEYKANKIKIKNFKSKLLKIEKSYKYIYPIFFEGLVKKIGEYFFKKDYYQILNIWLGLPNIKEEIDILKKNISLLNSLNKKLKEDFFISFDSQNNFSEPCYDNDKKTKGFSWIDYMKKRQNSYFGDDNSNQNHKTKKSSWAEYMQSRQESSA